jgi:uncharacterized delta-60 repeat protein
MKPTIFLFSCSIIILFSIRSYSQIYISPEFNYHNGKFVNEIKSDIYAFCEQNDGEIIIGTSAYNGIVYRLNPDFSIDTTFKMTQPKYGYRYEMVTNISLQQDGKIIITGEFDNISTFSRRHIARLNSNGSTDSAFGNIDENIRSQSGIFGLYFKTTTKFQKDGKILVGGYMSKYNDAIVRNLFRLNNDGSIDTTFKIGTKLDGQVKSLILLEDGKIIVGGFFKSYDNLPNTSCLVILNPDGSLYKSFSFIKPNGYIFSMVLDKQNRLLIAGLIAIDNKPNKHRPVIRINLETFTIDSTFKFWNNIGEARQIANISDGRYMLEMQNTYELNKGTEPVRFMLTNEGIIDSSFNYQGTRFTPGDNTYDVGFYENKDGSFFIGNEKITPSGKIDWTYNVPFGANEDVRTSAIQQDEKIVLGGNFTQYNNTSKSRIVRIDETGKLDTTFNIGKGFNGYVRSIKIQQDGKILVGGDFTKYDTSQSNHLARILKNGKIDNSFQLGSGVNGKINSIAIQDNGKILICGDFDKVNNVNRKGIALLNTDGSVDQSFDPKSGANKILVCNALKNGKFLIGGSFISYNNKPISGLARINSDGSLDSNFTTEKGLTEIYAIKTTKDNKIVIGGNFKTSKYRFYTKLNENGSLDENFQNLSSIDSTVFDIDILNDSLIVLGGNPNKQSPQLVILNQYGILKEILFGAYKLYNSSKEYFDNAIYTIAIQANYDIILGGAFSKSYQGVYSSPWVSPTEMYYTINHVARVSFSQTNPTGLSNNDAISNISSNVYPNPNQGTFIIKVEKEETFSLINNLGQTIKTLKLHEGNNTIEINEAENGIYFLKSNSKHNSNYKIIISK